jgi:hypothetical protein
MYSFCLPATFLNCKSHTSLVFVPPPASKQTSIASSVDDGTYILSVAGGKWQNSDDVAREVGFWGEMSGNQNSCLGVNESKQ